MEREKGNMQHINVAMDDVEDIQIVIDTLAERGLPNRRNIL